MDGCSKVGEKQVYRWDNMGSGEMRCWCSSEAFERSGLLVEPNKQHAGMYVPGNFTVKTDGKDGWGIMSLARLEDKCNKECNVCSKCSLSCVEKFGVKCIQDIACEDSPDCDNDDDLGINKPGHWI